MAQMNQNNGYAQQQPAGPTAILNECRKINDGINEVRAKREGQLAIAQNALLDSATEKEDQAMRQNLDYIEDEINNTFRYLRDLLKKVKQTPGSGDARVQGQIDVTNRNLRKEIEAYQKTQSDFQKRLRAQVRRRYEIANPEATPEEIDQGVENVLLGQEQSFQVRANSLYFTYMVGTVLTLCRSLAADQDRRTRPSRLLWRDPPRFGRSSRI